MLTSVVLAIMLSSQFTQKEIDNLPKVDQPDPVPYDFFTGPDRKPKKPVVKAQLNVQRQLMMNRAVVRRARTRVRDSRSGFDPDVEFARSLTRRFYTGE